MAAIQPQAYPVGPDDNPMKGRRGRWRQRKPDRETRRVKPREAKMKAPKVEEPSAEEPSTATATSQAEGRVIYSVSITDSDCEAEFDAVQIFDLEEIDDEDDEDGDTLTFGDEFDRSLSQRYQDTDKRRDTDPALPGPPARPMS